MNDEKPQEIQPSESSEKIEAPPAPPQPGKWQMPKPVFKKTSGYLPQGFEKIAGFGETAPKRGPAPTAAPAEAPPTDEFHNAAAETAPPVGEQPELLDEFDDDGDEMISVAPEPAKRSSRAFRIFLALVIFFAVMAFIAGFLYLIYVLFLSEAAASL